MKRDITSLTLIETHPRRYKKTDADHPNHISPHIILTLPTTILTIMTIPQLTIIPLNHPQSSIF